MLQKDHKIHAEEFHNVLKKIYAVNAPHKIIGYSSDHVTLFMLKAETFKYLYKIKGSLIGNYLTEEDRSKLSRCIRIYYGRRGCSQRN